MSTELLMGIELAYCAGKPTTIDLFTHGEFLYCVQRSDSADRGFFEWNHAVDAAASRQGVSYAPQSFRTMKGNKF